MDHKAKICIIGPGAIGGLVAGVLAREGFQVQEIEKGSCRITPENFQEITLE